MCRELLGSPEALQLLKLAGFGSDEVSGDLVLASAVPLGPLQEVGMVGTRTDDGGWFFFTPGRHELGFGWNLGGGLEKEPTMASTLGSEGLSIMQQSLSSDVPTPGLPGVASLARGRLNHGRRDGTATVPPEKGVPVFTLSSAYLSSPELPFTDS